MDDGEAFSYLLHTIRSKLGSIDKIDREKVLSYGIIDNKRVLKGTIYFDRRYCI